jgi:hypothetical protein
MSKTEDSMNRRTEDRGQRAAKQKKKTEERSQPPSPGGYDEPRETGVRSQKSARTGEPFDKPRASGSDE